MSLPVDIQYLTPEQNYLIADLARFTDQLVPYEGMGLCLQDMPIDNFSDDLKNLIREMIDKGLGSIKIWHVEHDTESGFDAIMFTDDYEHNGFSFGPTQGEADIETDLEVIRKEKNIEQYKRAWDFFNRYKDDGCNNFLFGYSLGGNLALYVYREFSKYVSKVNVFNALPIQNWIMSEEDKAKINQWTKDGDHVHNIGGDHSNEDNFSGSNVTRDSGLGWFFGDHTRKPGWFDGNGNVVGGYPSLIEVDTWKLRDYGIRLEKVQKRIIALNEKLATFNDPFINLSAELIKFIQNGISEFNNIFNGTRNKMVGCENDYDIGKYCSYLFWTAEELERIEDVILKNELNSLDA